MHHACACRHSALLSMHNMQWMLPSMVPRFVPFDSVAGTVPGKVLHLLGKPSACTALRVLESWG